MICNLKWPAGAGSPIGNRRVDGRGGTGKPAAQEQSLPIAALTLNGLQHVAIIAPIDLVFPLLVLRAAQADLALQASVISASLLALGIGTLLLCWHGRALGSGFLANDLLEVEEAQERLREDEARFRAIDATAPVALAILDRETQQLRHVNPRFCELMDINPADAVDETFHSLLPDSDDRLALSEVLSGMPFDVREDDRLRRQGMCIPLHAESERTRLALGWAASPIDPRCFLR